MIAGKIKFVKSHECIENKTTTIAIEQYTDGRVNHWYFNMDGKLHGIRFCPYCGVDLYKEERNMGKDVKELIESMSAEDREFFYECIRQTKVAVDIENFILEHEEYAEYVDDLASFAHDAAKDFEGPDYDATLSYWDNIEIVVQKALGQI